MKNDAFLGNVLIIEDEERLRRLYRRILTTEGFRVQEASSLLNANKIINTEDIEVVLCEVRLPDGNGIEYTRQVKLTNPNIEVIIITSFTNIYDGVQAIKNGAFDYLTKGVDNEKLLPILISALEKVKLYKQLHLPQNNESPLIGFENIIGESPKLKATINLAKKVAPMDSAVLLLGETGTGKELFAKAIHSNSKRAKKPFIALNCSAFSKELLESEIFGHKAGSFTGALKDKSGLIEEANEGTLFLDEIGELHIDLQAKLLRVLESQEFIKVGDTKSTQVNVRIISATNKNLQKEVELGRFREDLYYRLNVFTILLPPLRERNGDIKLLSNYFIKRLSHITGKKIDGQGPEYTEILGAHNWRGNIRELRNVIEHSIIMNDSGILGSDDLPPSIINQVIPTLAEEMESPLDMPTVEKMHIEKILKLTKGNKAEAAKILNIGLTTLYRKFEEYGLK